MQFGIIRFEEVASHMRIDPQPWMASPAVSAVFAALDDGGSEPVLRFVGGCVRDAILGRADSDIDLATKLLPETVIERLRAARVKVVPTGLAHGTVTAVAGPDRQPIEITTLRRDVATDGRHATVAYTEDWAADAARRDFTINALFADRDGTVHDFHGGVDDLTAGIVRFVGDARTRLAEDYLRLLRFFRFYASVGRPPVDRRALAACRELAPCLKELSGERMAKEILALLAVDDPLPAVRLMEDAAILDYVVPGLTAVDRLAALVALKASGLPAADPVRRLASLIDDGPGNARAVGERLKLSNANRDRLTQLVAPEVELDADADLPELHRALYRIGRSRVEDLLLLGWAGETANGPVAGSRVENWQALIIEAGQWKLPKFPLRGADGVDLGVEPGPRLGDLLAAVEAWWIDGDFAGGREACVAELKRRMDAAGS